VLFPPSLPARLGPHYTIEREIGRGGMAAVYQAADSRHHRTVAVKVLSPELAAAVGTTRFLQEITTVAGLNHPNIVPVYDSGEHERKQSIPLEEIVRLTGRIAAALDFAHRHHVVHRDIKPENIILFEGEPLILDFGIAKALSADGASTLTATGIAVGTPAYLSPEQASGGRDIDGRSDQYSLACTIYEMVAGKPPFTASSAQAIIAMRFTGPPRSLSDLVPTIPARFSDTIARALSLEPEDRFDSVSKMAQELKLSLTETERKLRAENRKPSLAVLPFTNVSTDPENEFFADGITEDIINSLTRLGALTIPSRTASFAFKKHSSDLSDIGRKLKVENLLEGSVRKAANHLRVSVQLVEVTSGNAIWSDRYDRELADVFAIQDEISSSIVDAMKLVLTRPSAARKPPTHNIRAYEYYIRGRQLYHQRRPETMIEAAEMYRKAIELDPNYALAYAGLADSLGVRYGSFGASTLSQSEEAAKHSLELDPYLAEAHASYGLVLSYQGRLDESQKEFERAMELDPTSYDTAYHYGRMLATKGDLHKAVEIFQHAASLRPDDFQAYAFLMSMYMGVGDLEKEQAVGRQMIEAAEHALLINPGDARALTLGAGVLARLGEVERGHEWLQRVLELDPDNAIVVMNAACVESMCGNLDESLAHMKRSIDLGFRNARWLRYDPDLINARKDPRFMDVIEKLEATLPKETQ